MKNNAYTSVETARALVNIDNSDCSAKVNSIVMQLKQIVRLNTSHHHYSRTFTVLRREFPGLEANDRIENRP